jgi:hypothetical protein
MDLIQLLEGAAEIFYSPPDDYICPGRNRCITQFFMEKVLQ